MQKLESSLETYEEKRRKVSQFHLTSDIFFSKVMEETKVCEEVIQILTGEKLIVKAVKSQYSIRNMENHSVVLDVLAEKEDGGMVNVEIHTREDEDHVRRVRFNLSSIDMSFFEKGKPYEELPDVYLIYITKADFIGNNCGINQVQRVIRQNGQVLNNGVYEFYVYLKGENVSEGQKELLNYILKSESNYRTDVFPHLAKRINLFKEDKEGIDIMCDIMRREREEGKVEGKVEGRVEGKIEGVIGLVRKKIEIGSTSEQIAKDLVLETDYVRRIVNLMQEKNRSDEEIAKELLYEIV